MKNNQSIKYTTMQVYDIYNYDDILIYNNKMLLR